MSAIVFFANFDIIFIYKKRLVRPYHEIGADTMTFLEILFVLQSKFSSRISDFFLLPYTRLFHRLTGTPRVKSFSSCQTVFSIIWMLLSNKGASTSFSVSNPFLHLWCFHALQLLRFHFSPFSILMTN